MRGAAEARRLLAEWETSAKPPAATQPAGQSPVPSGPSLPSLDAGAVALESAAAALDELESRIKSLDEEREALDRRLMLRAVPGVFCAGEMLDWEAPTGGYLLTACLASGRAAGLGALAWLDERRRARAVSYGCREGES